MSESESGDGLHRFTAREFEQMLQTGVFGDEPERLELLDGGIYSAMAEGTPHRRTVNGLTRLLKTRFPEPYIVQIQMSLHLGEHDVPSPDVVVYRADGDAYRSFVDMNDVVLAMEVSDTSLRKDRLLKKARYALHAVPEYWIVNVRGPEIEIYREPHDGFYSQFRLYAALEPIVQSALPGEPLRPCDLVRT